MKQGKKELERWILGPLNYLLDHCLDHFMDYQWGGEGDHKFSVRGGMQSIDT